MQATTKFHLFIYTVYLLLLHSSSALAETCWNLKTAFSQLITSTVHCTAPVQVHTVHRYALHSPLQVEVLFSLICQIFRKRIMA